MLSCVLLSPFLKNHAGISKTEQTEWPTKGKVPLLLPPSSRLLETGFCHFAQASLQLLGFTWSASSRSRNCRQALLTTVPRTPPLSLSLLSHPEARLERGWSLSLLQSSPVTGIKPKMSDPVTCSISGIFWLCLYDHTNQKDPHRSGLCSTLELLCVLASEKNGGIMECSASPHVHCGLSVISTLLWINRLDF